MISNGNTKIGAIPNFSLPAIKTCPGQTDFCPVFCYGLRGHFTHRSREAMLERNYRRSQQDNFAGRMIRSIQDNASTVFRIHVVGDFYSPEYIQKWVVIIGALPDVSFYGYTRSWRCRDLQTTLDELRSLPNCHLLASIDFTHTDRPDSSWNTVSVEGEGVPCPHDTEMVETCLTCGLCWSGRSNLKLKIKWFSRRKNFSPLLI